jgi:hypothetical protein
MPGKTAIETADMPETNAKKIATSRRELASPLCPNILFPFPLFRARFLPFPEAGLAGLGIARGFDGAYLGEGAVCRNDRSAG